MLKHWRTTKFALAASAVALVLCGGTAAADSGGAFPHPLMGGYHAPVHHWVFPQGAFGTVSSVNGDSTAGTCGTAGTSGSFTVTGWQSTVTTVDVTAATTFAGSLMAPPTFANVCVGKLAAAVGPLSSATVTAAKVFVIRAPAPPTQRGAFGTVTSVDGVTTTGACGTAGAAGSFTLTSWQSDSSTVEVSASTTFNDPTAAPPSFADVCVGAVVGALGTVSADTVTATKVCVVPAPTPPVSSPIPPPPATGATTASTDPTPVVTSHAGNWAAAPPHGPTPVAPPAFGQHGFGPPALAAHGDGPSGRPGWGTAGNSDPQAGYGGHSGGFSGQGHGWG